MRKINLLIVSFVLAQFLVVHAKTYWPRPSYYHYQVGATFGVNKISVGLADGPGSHWGLQMRIDRHTFGFKQEWDGEFLKLWGEPMYYRRTGIYYGLTQAGQYFQWAPQLGFGIIQYHPATFGSEPPRPVTDGWYGEIAVSGLVNLRGNGFGCKVFLNLNRFVPILGATIYLQTGWAWNEKPKDARAKMGASPTIPTL